MKQGRIYPAIFQQDGDYITVSFPDLPGCNTQGKGFVEAYRCAREALGLYLDDYDNAPAPSDLIFIDKSAGGRVMLVEEDIVDNIVYYKQEQVPQIMRDKLAEHGFTKYKLAKVLDVSESYINLIAKGTRRPSPDMAKRIALVLDFDWQVFYS